MSDPFEMMSEEEKKARSEAALLGQLKIMHSAIEGLIATAPQPDFIQLQLMSTLAGIVNHKEEHPSLQWVPEAISAGAGPLAEKFIKACQINKNMD